jgi:hypothetical protein
LLEQGRQEEGTVHDRELLSMRIKLDEARFFFPAKERAIFSRIEALAKEHEEARYVMKNTKDEEDRRKAGEPARTSLLRVYTCARYGHLHDEI